MMAFDRQKMLADESDASAVIFFQAFPINAGDPLPCDAGFQPALQSHRSAVDVDGAAAPPPGTPGYFLHYVTQGPGCDNAAPLLRLDTLAVDWATPSAAQYVDGASEFPIDGWSAPGAVNTPTGEVPNGNVCFAPMNRSVYRNFGDHESIVANHPVGTTSSAPGIRWYELQRQASGPWHFAQPPGTFALASGSNGPLGIGLGSIAMDHAGDVALGYIFGSQDVPQSVGAAARLSTDMAGSLPRFGVLQHGFATNEASHEVDYTQMTVDPVDDCTFWYVGSFAPSPPRTGTDPFKTSISAFKLPGCGAPSAIPGAPTFTG
jgi:hypothetical protein